MKNIVNVLFVLGCFLSVRSEAASVNVDGQVFIVTKGQQAIKLALVNVVALSEKDLASAVAIKTNQIVADRKELADLIERKKAEVVELKAAAKYMDGSGNSPFLEIDRLQQVCKLTNDLDAFRQCVNTPEGKESIDRIKRLKSLYKDEMEPANTVSSQLRPLIAQHRKATANLRHILTAENLSENFIARTKTDGDGKFSLSLPVGQRIAVLADTSRTVMDDTETYQWLVWYTPKKGGKNSIILANDNLTETICESCVRFDTIDMRTYPDVRGNPENIVVK